MPDSDIDPTIDVATDVALPLITSGELEVLEQHYPEIAHKVRILGDWAILSVHEAEFGEPDDVLPNISESDDTDPIVPLEAERIVAVQMPATVLDSKPVHSKVVDKDKRANDEDLVKIYFKDVSRQELLTKEQEVILAQTIERGVAARAKLTAATEPNAVKIPRREKKLLKEEAQAGDEAHNTFVQSNLPLVISIAKRFQGSGLPLLDLVQEGNLGLIHAVDKFEWRKGFKLSTYATQWILKFVRLAAAEQPHDIRLPAGARTQLKQILKAQTNLNQKLGRRVTTAEVAEELEMKEGRVTELLRATNIATLAEPVGEDGNATLGDIIKDPTETSTSDEACVAQLPTELSKLLKLLDEQEMQIVSLHHGLEDGVDRPFASISRYLGLQNQKTLRIYARAIGKLRAEAESKEMGAFLE